MDAELKWDIHKRLQLGNWPTPPHTHTYTHTLCLNQITCDWMMAWLPLNGDLRSLSLRWRLLRLLR